MPHYLGLRRHTVRLSVHQPQWAGAFARLATDLRGLLGDLVLEVEHVGSTAIADLPAKPILDVAVAVATVAVVPEFVAVLTGHDFIYRGDGGENGGHLFVRESSPAVRVAHVHVVRADDPQWQSYLAFRDRLRADADLRARYGAVKLELAERFPNDRRGYTAGKSDFVRSCLATAGIRSGPHR